MSIIVLEIDEATPSLNRMLGRHWSHRSRLRDRWAWLVRRARLRAHIPAEAPFARARLTFERTGGRICDAENALAGTKYVTDQLVREGLIANDSPAHIGTPTLIQHVHPTLRQTVVRIEAMS